MEEVLGPSLLIADPEIKLASSAMTNAEQVSRDLDSTATKHVLLAGLIKDSSADCPNMEEEEAILGKVDVRGAKVKETAKSGDSFGIQSVGQVIHLLDAASADPINLIVKL